MSASSRDRLQRVVAAASSAVGPMTPPNPVVGAIESADTPAPAPLGGAIPAAVPAPPVQLVPDTAADRPVETARTSASSARDEPTPRARRENRGRAKQPADIYKADPRSGWTHTNARCKEDTKRLVQMLLAPDPNRDISDLTESLFREWIAREAERLNIPQTALAKMVRTG